ncbi:MAG TPA: IPT/TIG domain-containing protein [Candidatus Sulfotelmatobacter sp.]|nr:IPT/TIG domain-containing protein [Candidatus Sulfotelmatobacter sp.]
MRLTSPDSAVGKTIQIIGGGLMNATSVTFGSVQATFTAHSQTYVSAIVPANAVAGFVTVTTPTATFTGTRQFQVIPTVTNISPVSGATGSQVAITGTGLLGATQVAVGGVQATTFTVNSATSITATVPTGAVTGKIVVKEPGTSGASAGVFTVTP